LDSFGDVSGGTAKEAELVVKVGAVSPGELVFRLFRVWKTDGWWLLCSEVEPLPWVELELVFFCFEELFARLVSDLLESDLGSDLFPEIRMLGFRGNFATSSQYVRRYAWTSFRVLQGIQLIVVDHVILDSFGKSIVSLSAECGFAH